MTERCSNQVNDIYFRSSQDLVLSNNNYNILLIGSCYVEYLLNKFKQVFNNNKYYYYSNTNNIDINIKYHYLVCNYSLRFIECDSTFFTINHSEEEVKKFMDECLNKLFIEINKNIEIAKKFDIPLFYIGYIIPQFPTFGRLIKKHSLQNHSYFIQRLNESLEEYLLNNQLEYKNCYYVDAESSASTYGKKLFLDDIFFIESHNSIGYDVNFELDLDRLDKYINTYPRMDKISDTHYKSLCIEINSMYRTLNRIDEIKLVIFDLDGTVWRGIPAENNIQTNEGWPSAVQEAILVLNKRGIILAISSKNDAKFIEENWSTLVNNRIPYDIFAIKKINFDDKVKNIEEIINTVNLLPSNVLFVDDNPRERDAVKQAFPQIRVIGEDVLFWKKCLLTSSELQPVALTEESLNKQNSIRQMEERNSIKKLMSNEEFLLSLHLKLKFVPSNEIHLNRIFELFNKTNQFNSIGIRYSKEQINDYIKKGYIYHGEVADIHVDYGIVISAIVVNNIIIHMVMSCRVFNLGIEKAFIIIIMNIKNSNPNLNTNKKNILNIEFKLSDKNSPCLNSLTNIGFDMSDVSNNEIKLYTIQKENIKNIPVHIDILF